MKSSREQFEEWYVENWGHTEDHHETMFERDPDFHEDYYRLGVRLAHHSWQAIRAEIEIELPWLGKSSLMDTDDVVEAIKLQGLTAKAKQ